MGRKSLSLAVALAVAAVLSAALVAAASAHHGEAPTGETEPGTLGAQNTGDTLSTDTEITPVGKDGAAAGWQQIGGSLWRPDGTITDLATPGPGQDSPTPYDLDFYGVGFPKVDVAMTNGLSQEAAGIEAQTNGFAVGAQCRRDPKDPDTPVLADQVEGCDRIPAIYRYYEHPTKGLIWEESYRGSDEDDPGGFVAAVAWLTPNRALAVGGTGTYPRREQERPPGVDDSSAGDTAYAKRDACQHPPLQPGERCQGAGMARAWLYTQDPETKVGSWRELQNEPDPEGGFTGEDGDELPDEMRALHAIDASHRPSDCGFPDGIEFKTECAITGGMRQLWHFADGRFVRGYGPELGSPPGEGMIEWPFTGDPSSSTNFRFRVRAIRVRKEAWADPFRPVFAEALTSGCCSADAISEDRPSTLTLGTFETGLNNPPISGWRARRARPLGTPSLLTTNLGDYLGDRANNYNADSYYGFGLRTPGGPSERYEPREPPSRFGQPALITTPLNLNQSILGTLLSTLRLVSADGNWAVGVLRSSGRAVAFGGPAGPWPGDLSTPSIAQGKTFVDPRKCAGDENNQLLPGAEQPVCNFEAYQRQNASKRLYSLPSYMLNGFSVAGEDPVAGVEGAGWGVGDHGAIATRGGGVAGAETPPARRGAKSAAEPVPGAGAFDRHRPPVTDQPGTVPALIPGTMPAEPGFTEGQGPSGEGANRIVMSRDGSEGWAFGSNDTYRYNGVRWVRCDRDGIEDLVPADPACTDAPAGVLRALVRVPLEHDPDPTNDDQFEALALTSVGIHRYRLGRWLLDKKLSSGPPTNNQGSVLSGDIAFVAPDDGWAVRPVTTKKADAVAESEIEVLHFNGERWVPCTRIGTATAPEECGDPDASRRLRVQGLCTGGGGVSSIFARGATRLAVAGERVYLYTARDAGPRTTQGGSTTPCTGTTPDPYPVILYRDPGGTWRGGEDTDLSDGYNPTDGGWDPGCVEGSWTGCVATEEAEHRGLVESLSVARNADGSFHGWAVGIFGGTARDSAKALLMRLGEGSGAAGASGARGSTWGPWVARDAAYDYLRYAVRETSDAPTQPIVLPAEAGARNAFLFVGGKLTTVTRGSSAKGIGRAPALAFDEERGRWIAIPAPWPASPLRANSAPEFRAAAADNRGGFWVSVGNSFQHYTDRAPKPVFSEVPHPAAGRARTTALGAGANGTVWLGDASGGVYRYDRLAGWSARIEIPGWEPARATTRAAVNAIAVGPDGAGVAAGPGGRIASLGERVGLDPAAAIGCDPQASVPPCGTGRDLLAAAVAPDGSAIVAGQNRTLLWRPPSGEFRPVAGPPPAVPAATPIVEVSMPSPERAWLLTGAGHGNKPAARVIRGEMLAPGRWEWTIELGDSGGAPDPLTVAPPGNAFVPYLTIRDIAVDATGHGYAVGDDGLVLERNANREGLWRRMPTAAPYSLQSVTLPEGGGNGALIGDGARVLTLIRDRFEVAHDHTPFGADNEGGSLELALTPGYRPGEAEAWGLGRNGLLHYPPDPSDPRLNPTRGFISLSDSPAPTPGEISFAAFGKQDCDGARPAQGAGQLGMRNTCGPPDGSNRATADLVGRRVVEELIARPANGAKPRFALFTGDAVDVPGGQETLTDAFIQLVRTPLDPNLKHRRWTEIIAEPLAQRGIATLGAIGGQDLARNLEYCNIHVGSSTGGCPKPSQAGVEQLGLQAGSNLPWRTAMTSLPAPWEREQQAGGLRLERVGAGVFSQRGPDASTPHLPPVPLDLAHAEGYPLDSGDTHYAVDAIDEQTDEKLARIVVVDTSMGSIAASDPQQHPIEAGGQLRWLEEVLCFEGSAEDTDGDVRDCTREPGQQAIVLSNTPTYSYGPISPEETQTDAAAFEAILLKNRVNVVVSGRLGWNGRYWAIAPGVHAPCPGQDYRSDSEAPSLGQPEICGASANAQLGTSQATDKIPEITSQLPEAAQDASGLASRGAIPFVVSSTAGGRFNEKAVRGGFATAENGFWRGYSIVRLHPSGDPAKTIVEQRPILDWVGLSTHDPSVPPGERLQLQSFAREAFGMDTAPRYYEIPETQVITHRWHLLLADPGEPWRACEASDSTCQAYYAKLAEGSRSFDSAAASGSGSAQDDNSGASASGSGSAQDDNSGASASGSGSAQDDKCSPYLCLPERIGTIDPNTGEIRAGNGKYPDTFALATLSVGQHVAAQPLVFTKSPSFIVNPAASLAEIPPPPTETGSASAPPPPPGTPVPNVPQASVPNPPPVPPIAPLQAAEPPEPQPPAPPAPPPPSEAPAPLDLTLAPPGITVATPTAVIQPPTPPVNPAPPGGARREARQRQAAAQKSGADSDMSEGAENTRSAGGDFVQGQQGAEGAEMRRSERTRPEPSFTPLARAEQPSAWTQGALYGGALGLMALVAAIGFTHARPTPRRRPPEVPAPAHARAWRRTR